MWETTSILCTCDSRPLIGLEVIKIRVAIRLRNCSNERQSMLILYHGDSTVNPRLPLQTYRFAIATNLAILKLVYPFLPI